MYLHITPEWLHEICLIREEIEGETSNKMATTPSSYPAQISEILALTLENEVIDYYWLIVRGRERE